jgi:eukaryotic-like serine/threonine-protein kinase
MKQRDELERLSGAGRFLEAAQLAERVALRAEAARLYERAGERLPAAMIFRDLGMFTDGLRAALGVPASHPGYGGAARLVIGMAASLRLMSQEIESFLAAYLEQPPASLEDRDAFFLLGQLYEVLSYTNHALELFHRVARSDSLHPVHAHLRAAQNATPQHTLESVAGRGDFQEVRRRLAASPASTLQPWGLSPGQVIADRYRVQRLLGEGGSASVYAVLDTALGEAVALKLFTHSAQDSTLEARFRREVSLARQLVHKNIVRLFDLGRHGEQGFLTMELIDGTHLGVVIEEHKLDDRKKRELLLQALDGLECAHENRVLHRDIKPENMFVTSAGVLKIADFGLAKRAEDQSITVSGSLGGTPYYISPEQMMNLRTADHRSDLYSLGIVAYELFAGVRPFESSNVTELLLMQLQATAEPLRSHRPELPQALEDMIAKLLAKAREDRFQSCREVSTALRAIAL